MPKSRQHFVLKIALVSLQVTLVLVTADFRTDAQHRRAPTKQPTPTPWYTFLGPDGDFSLAFPAKPAPSHAESEEPVTSIRHYDLSTKDGKYFSVNVNDVGGEPRSVAANEFETDGELDIAAAARRRGETVNKISRLSKNTIEMEVWQPAGDAQKLHRIDRYIIRHSRVYTLGCGSLVNRQPVNTSMCRRFFNSIQFTQ